MNNAFTRAPSEDAFITALMRIAIIARKAAERYTADAERLYATNIPLHLKSVQGARRSLAIVERNHALVERLINAPSI